MSPQTMMSACSRLTALPAQFARGRTASLTARTAKFTAQVSSKQHIMLGPLLFFPSPRRGNFPRHARRRRRSQLIVQPRVQTSARTRKSDNPYFLANAIYSLLYLRFHTQRSSVRARASLHDFKGKTLGGGTRSAPVDGEEFDFAQLKGKVVLINNVATM